MPSSCFFFVLLLGAVVASPAKQLSYRKSGDVSDSRLGIYDGEFTTIEEHPYLVSVIAYATMMCAGSIIAESWVITSADCVSGITAGELTIIAGAEDGASGGTMYSVSDVIIHPSYGKSLYDYDYALIKIQGKFKWSTKVKSVNLPKKKAKGGSKGVVVGWGPAFAKGSNSALLQGEMNILSQEDCESVYSKLGLYVTDRMLCSYNQGSVSPCNGDWADPLTQENVLYSMFILVATSGECTENAYPAIGANVRTAVPWIKNVTGLAFD